MECDSKMNARIIEAFIQRNVKCEVTDLINYIIDVDDNSGDSPLDLDPLFDVADPVCPYCGGVLDIESCQRAAQEESGYLDYVSSVECPECGIEVYTDEILWQWDTVDHWFAVTKSLAKRLEREGQIVLNEKYWGRDGAWDTLSRDPVVLSICEKLEILTGQKNCPIKTEQVVAANKT